METAMVAKLAFKQIKPDCVAVELPEALEATFLRATARLPDISILSTEELYYMVEPCDACFEALRSAQECGAYAYCIDLAVHGYPEMREPIADPYSIVHIGFDAYYNAYLRNLPQKLALDDQRELYMARRLKELSLQHERVFFVGGFFHVHRIMELVKRESFHKISFEKRDATLATLTEKACREAMAECGYFTLAYEQWRQAPAELLDRQQLIYTLYKEAATLPFPSYNLRNMMKFVRNYALIGGRLMPDLYEILMGARGCVNHSYARDVWELATNCPFLKNIDNLPQLDLTAEQIWGASRQLKFKLKKKTKKGEHFFFNPSSFSICSHPPEDLIIENFGDFLKKKGSRIQSDQMAHTIPFTTSLEDGIDTRDTIRHWFEHKLYVKVRGRIKEPSSSVVIIFDEDEEERFFWKTTWLGEHDQESDMAFYATPMNENIVGPGICRCEYGGLMLTSPPGRLYNIWSDKDYFGCHSKAEVLLMAAIEYATDPVVVYVANKPPSIRLKGFASRFGRKLTYLPIGQLSPIMLKRIRFFHVLDGRDKREIAGDFIID